MWGNDSEVGTYLSKPPSANLRANQILSDASAKSCQKGKATMYFEKQQLHRDTQEAFINIERRIGSRERVHVDLTKKGS
jgi:hypothetical protein